MISYDFLNFPLSICVSTHTYPGVCILFCCIGCNSIEMAVDSCAFVSGKIPVLLTNVHASGLCLISDSRFPPVTNSCSALMFIVL